jgi:hypothetical protein
MYQNKSEFNSMYDINVRADGEKPKEEFLDEDQYRKLTRVGDKIYEERSAFEVTIGFRSRLPLDMHNKERFIQKAFRHQGRIMERTLGTPFYKEIVDDYQKGLDTANKQMLRVAESVKESLDKKMEEGGRLFKPVSAKRYQVDIACMHTLENTYISLLEMMDDIACLIDMAVMCEAIPMDVGRKMKGNIFSSCKRLGARITTSCIKGTSREMYAKTKRYQAEKKQRAQGSHKQQRRANSV